eukprot:SAG11_NODE_299_length_11075_cov_15.266764_8_plen_135_part_00
MDIQTSQQASKDTKGIHPHPQCNRLDRWVPDIANGSFASPAQMDRPLELDEPRWFRQSGKGWVAYSSSLTREIEIKYALYMKHLAAVRARRKDAFYQERLENKSGVALNVSEPADKPVSEHFTAVLTHRTLRRS